MRILGIFPAAAGTASHEHLALTSEAEKATDSSSSCFSIAISLLPVVQHLLLFTSVYVTLILH